MTDVVERTDAVVDFGVRCWRCRREIAVQATRPWLFKCWNCHVMNGSPPPHLPRAFLLNDRSLTGDMTGV